MESEKGREIFSLKNFLLTLILALAFYMAFIPKLEYPYPVHIDEWNLMARMEAMQNAGTISYADPYSGESVDLFGKLEAGFILFWGVFQSISDLSWLIIFRYFPGIVFVITVLSVYIMGRSIGFGLEAAFFTCLVTSTLGILGPAFIVPVAMGMIFIPLAFFLAFNYRHIGSYITIFLFTCFLLAMHPPSGAFLFLILGPYALISLKGDFKHGLGVLLSIGLPFLAPLFLIYNELISQIKGLFEYHALSWWIDYPNLVLTYGYIPIAFCILGAFVLSINKNKVGYGLLLGLLAVVLMLATYFSLHYGHSIMYVRGFIFAMLMISCIAGAGLMWIKNLKLPENLMLKIRMPSIFRNVGVFFAFALCVAILVTAIPSRQSIPYYHMIDDYDYEVFVWIKDNIDDSYNRAILDPWKGTAFTAITMKKVYVLTHSFPTPTTRAAQEFLNNGSSNTTFLRENGISIVYTKTACTNPDLKQVRENVYLLE